MKAVHQDEPGGKLFIREVPIPEPGPGQVLVKMDYSPVNPSDLSMLQGTYAGKRTYPIIPGIEGSGQVVKAGKGIIPSLRSGKQVACTAGNEGGTWAEYMVTQVFNTIPYSRKVNSDKASMLLVNPLTAISLIRIAIKGNHKALVNNAAGSALGKMLIHLAEKNHLKLVNIVRNEKHINALRDIGAENILRSDDPDFENQLTEAAEKLNIKLFLDAVGGEQTEMMLKNSPGGSRIICYGKLSEKEASVNTRYLIQENKTLEGFSLGKYLSDNSTLQNLRLIGGAKKLINEYPHISITGKYSIDKIEQAISNYRSNMSSGKVLLDLRK